MRKHIFIFGQCTLHWGRMEFGNIGNYYIVNPMFKELRRVFPDAEIVTTMQFSKEFCEKFNLETVPMECYYDFSSSQNAESAYKEYLDVCTGGSSKTRFVQELEKADLAIDFSGDIWGDNADFLGKGRFLAGLYKDLTAQKICKTVMIAGSPGPFNNQKDIDFVKKVFAGFNFVSNREPISTRKLKALGFTDSNQFDYACPSFLFEKAEDQETRSIIGELKGFTDNKLKIGVVLCGWNFEKGPYDLWPRRDEEYDKFFLMIENLIKKFDSHIFLMSHSNGFDIPPKPFRLKQGRDFPIMQQMERILVSKGYSDYVTLLDGVYTPELTKGIISNFDILISGRMHGAVAGLSQCIPTVIIDYGHEPKAHKSRGFAEVVGMEHMIADPADLDDLIEKTERCVSKKEELQKMLEERIPIVQQSARKQFDELVSLL